MNENEKAQQDKESGCQCSKVAIGDVVVVENGMAEGTHRTALIILPKKIKRHSTIKEHITGCCLEFSMGDGAGWVRVNGAQIRTCFYTDIRLAS